MLSDGLFERVLLAPVREQGFRRLRIVSGYATAGMASWHMEELGEFLSAVTIELIVGMSPRAGIEEVQHRGLQALARKPPNDMQFSCRYVVRGNPVHAKVYIWLEDDRPKLAYAGSANYTVPAFRRSQPQVEVMVPVDPEIAARLHTKILPFTEDCADEDIERKIVLKEAKTANDRPEDITLSLLTRKGDTPEKSGINWGQRPGREKNQAYINIPVRIGESGFFPERYERFAVLTDDGTSFVMVRAQDSGKGLETPHNNSLLGEYLRKRIGVGSGEYVTREHLERYGRTDVTFIKIDNETYLMNFRSGGD